MRYGDPGQRSALYHSGSRCKGQDADLFKRKTENDPDPGAALSEAAEICPKKGVAREKVFPHNLRHLFARCFYRASRDISALANMLGHSSIETTRIYLVSTEDVYAKKIAHLGLVQWTK